LYFAHIFSAGLTSGKYGGRKTKTIFSGMINILALRTAKQSRNPKFKLNFE
jgi:hypothetical protein